MAFRLPRLPFIGLTAEQMQIYWQQLVIAIEDAVNVLDATIIDVQTQVTALADLNSDDLLTPSKKPFWIFINSVLTGEQAGLDSQATSYGITTAKTSYDSAVTALGTHLATLTTPVLWSNLTGNTTIVGTTFRTKFNDVMVKKQVLINAITAAAKVLADAAQTQANTATTNAATATTNAATAQTAANLAKLNDKISASATVPSNSLTATDAGANATITIAANVRQYGDGTSLSVSGGSLTGKSYSTVYAIYYDDATVADTTPTYVATTTLKDAQPGKVSGRHYVGQITTPASGGGATGGGYVPPGGGGPYP